jgi:glycosyltransferase involved in cell wall biosynthesis
VVLDTGDLDAWTGAIRGLLDDPERCARLGTESRRHALASYTYERMGRRFAEVLEWALKPEGPFPRDDG